MQYLNLLQQQQQMTGSSSRQADAQQLAQHAAHSYSTYHSKAWYEAHAEF
jgi:hypothetical protein